MASSRSPAAVRSIAVVIPAHNEGELIARCLCSVRAAARRLRSARAAAPDIRPIVVLDACSDGTERAVGEFEEVRAITVHARRVGAARRAGAEFALHSSPAPEWLACTDADSVVPPHWLTMMVDFAERGADLVLGTVQPDASLSARRFRRWELSYRNVEGHPHVHGANLGIAAAAYHALGGWPDEECGEDALLVHHAVRAGLSVVRTPEITVQTSGRLRGRAPAGFASYLSALVP